MFEKLLKATKVPFEDPPRKYLSKDACVIARVNGTENSDKKEKF